MLSEPEDSEKIWSRQTVYFLPLLSSWRRERITEGMRGSNKKIVVALSGGVDSAVSAAILRDAGHDVTGVFIKVWQPDFMSCSAEEDRLEAMRAAAFLNIPFETVDLGDAYKRDVVDYMVEEYRAGRTPNPDVMCNRSVKFGALWEWAKERSFDAIATGHYAQIKARERAREVGVGGLSERLELHAGADPAKDQSYFLWTLTEEDLSHIIFPVGGMQKSEVRERASALGLPNATRKDSQGLCFIGKLDMKEFLRHFIDTSPGEVLDEQGVAIGRHDGAMLYTLGERRGFTVEARSPQQRPYYIVAKDVERNTLTVAPSALESSAGDHKRALLQRTNWIGDAPQQGASYGARIRYRQPLQSCRVDGDTVTFDTPQSVLPPGQSLVIYEGTRVVGGGRMASVDI